MQPTTQLPADDHGRPRPPWSGLNWPQLVATLSLGMRPGRVFLGLVLALAIWAAGVLPSMWLHGESTPMERAVEAGSPVVERLFDAFVRLDGASVAAAVRFLIVDLPGKVAVDQPWSTAATLAMSLLAWALLGGAIARSSATEFALRESISTRQSVRFSLARWRSSFAALATPLVVATVLALVIGALGALAASSSTAGGVVALAFVTVLLLALGAVVALVGFALGFPLLVSAVVCEGTDAIDSLQRTFAYVLGRPVRLVLYSLVFYAQVSLSAFVCSTIASATISFALRWFFAPESTDRLAHTSSFARDVHAAWMLLLAALASGAVLSIYHSGAAVLYLLLRQANDGQDPADLWKPGSAEAVRAKKAETAEGDTTNGAVGEGDDV